MNVTRRRFYENRFLPQKEQQWKIASRPKTKRFIENYLLKRFGDTLLGDLGKFTLQTYLNEMAPRFVAVESLDQLLKKKPSGSDSPAN